MVAVGTIFLLLLPDEWMPADFPDWQMDKLLNCVNLITQESYHRGRGLCFLLGKGDAQFHCINLAKSKMYSPSWKWEIIKIMCCTWKTGQGEQCPFQKGTEGLKFCTRNRAPYGEGLNKIKLTLKKETQLKILGIDGTQPKCRLNVDLTSPVLFPQQQTTFIPWSEDVYRLAQRSYRIALFIESPCKYKRSWMMWDLSCAFWGTTTKGETHKLGTGGWRNGHITKPSLNSFWSLALIASSIPLTEGKLANQ